MRDGNSPSAEDEATTADASAAVTAGEPGAVQVIVGADRTRIVLSGEVDADLGPELQEATAEAEQRGLPIEVDAHHVTFMDSSGVAFLARLSIRSEHRVRLLRVPPTVRFLLEVTRIGELLDVVDDDEAPFEPVEPTA
ncbi:STAS domain-containing protein [Cellulomonas wangsupingiae]|uniref:STAS domain-containing protein n=1 Tax=Cellulomonas wangsupingiae TaxID=2968085 RepID=A0ABY5K2S6_9CELL|nr:STAS domain-containing protein [Cellulomonas wangsupingiae]MCC2336242.1 STAS domain-containing protein [Cellulomonas wangsupingiae]MCM0640552.1 STAS domain-containing protein [Cellulomonas wangsupingiae]UUI64514.1 STAS domain-containing protein [Cellulomonas wangsupingiae]